VQMLSALTKKNGVRPGCTTQSGSGRKKPPGKRTGGSEKYQKWGKERRAKGATNRKRNLSGSAKKKRSTQEFRENRRKGTNE